MTDWKLVPVEPTKEMLRGVVCFGNTPGQVYKSMLAAAPRPDLSELRALVEKWRKDTVPITRNVDEMLAFCADELEALIERLDGHPRTRG